MKRLLFSLLLLPLISKSQHTALGQWRDHLSFAEVNAVESNEHFIFGASDQGIIKVDLSDNSISRITRVNGLNDFSVTAIRYDSQGEMLLVGYQNGNLDLITETGTTNIPDIKKSSLVGDKTINNIHIEGNLAYLASGFGIVVYDLKRQEIKDTYKFGPNGTLIQVNDLCLFAGKIYAATESGVYSADLSNNFLSNFESWTKDNSLPQPSAEYTEIEAINSTIYCNQKSTNDFVYSNSGNGWQTVSGLPTAKFNSLRTNDGKLVVSGSANIIVINDQGTIEQTITRPIINGRLFSPTDAVYENGAIWIGEIFTGLLKTVNGTVFDSYTPNGPQTNNVFKLFAEGGYVYIASGAVNQIYNNEDKRDGIPYYNGVEWKTPDEYTSDSLKDPRDFLGVTIDPKNPAHSYVGSWGGGLIEMLNGEVLQVYNKNNSKIQETVGFGNNYRIASSAFDANGNLWVGNSFAANNLVLKRANGEWYSFKMGADFGSSSAMIVSQVLVAQDGTKWMIRHRNGIYAYNENNTLSNVADDDYRGLDNQPNTGGLPSNFVFCMAEDLDGELWLGTDKGFAILYSPGSVFQGGPINASQPIIEQDGNYEKILETEVINSIAVDGGNRKWMATQGSGVYLLSEDGTKQIQHFTTENSPLLSNEVFSIAIDQKSGEIFMGTSLGVQSYLSDATGSESEMSTISVYPNPVRPDHDGPIALRGLIRDANVKITDISGNLVFETRSEGGQAIWNGLNFRGERCATGAYVVLSTNSDGSETAQGKIIFIK